MEDRRTDLALAFIQSHPEVAAGILEHQPPEDTAVFLKDVPYHFVAPVLSRMLPHYSARIFPFVSVPTAVGFLTLMDISLVAAILRHLEREVYRGIMEELPTQTRAACKLLLNYSVQTVGAWMEPRIFTLPQDCTGEEALTRLTRENFEHPVEMTYVVDRDRNLKGTISVVNLLGAQGNRQLSSMMGPAITPLTGRTTLLSAQWDEGWESYDTLPVINRNRQLVGALQHVNLRRGLAKIATVSPAASSFDPLTGVCEAYGDALTAVAGSFGAMISMALPKNNT